MKPKGERSIKEKSSTLQKQKQKEIQKHLEIFNAFSDNPYSPTYNKMAMVNPVRFLFNFSTCRL